MTQALIAFGANAGEPRERFSEASKMLAKADEISVVAIADLVITKAVLGKSDTEIGDAPDDYLNSAILVETSLTARQLFDTTSGIEQRLGRQRKERWGPRAIDLDILLFGQQKIMTADLQVPHPRMSFRKFVIEPATEIAPDFIEPISGVTLKTLSQRLSDSPAKIAWINGDSKQDQSASSALAIVDRMEWEYEIAVNLSGLRTPLEGFRLLAFADAESNFETAAAQFAGPWLNLVELSPQQRQREILAAVEAMA